jgi:hypothetical protein
MAAGGAVDQLRGDPHAAAGLAHAAFEHMADLQLPRDLWHVDVLALEREGGIARGDPQRGDLGEVGDDVLGDAIGKILLLGIAAHVGEREHANGDTAPHVGLGVLDRRNLGRAQDEHVQRALNILDRVLAQVLECARHLARNVVADRGR